MVQYLLIEERGTCFPLFSFLQQRHLSNRERKAAAKAARKQAAMETRKRSKAEGGTKTDKDGSKDDLGATAI